jgi:hypothetical protein
MGKTMKGAKKKARKQIRKMRATTGRKMDTFPLPLPPPRSKNNNNYNKRIYDS